MRFLAQGETVGGHYREPHIYGSAVELRMFADKLVPPEDTAAFRASLLAYLEERGDDAKSIAGNTGSESQRLIRLVLDGKNGSLTSTLVPLVEQFTPDSLLSPLWAPHAPRCPVYLLHGAEDNVIPASETSALADSLSGKCNVEALVTDLIQHVELKKQATLPPVVSFYRMSRFWTRLLRE
jgi:pimeloyl-ACP methyl ester carboxylesterase